MNKRMPASAQWANRSLGIDWNEGSPLIVQATRKGMRRTILKPQQPAADTEGSHRSGTAIIAGMPPGQAMAVRLQTPLNDPAKAKRVLPTLLDVSMPFTLEDCVTGFSPLEAIDRNNRQPASADDACFTALAVAARREDVEAQINMLTQRGFEPHVLDHEGIALWSESFAGFPAPKSGIRAVLWVRKCEVLLAIGTYKSFWRAHRITDLSGKALIRTIRLQRDAMQAAGNNTLSLFIGGTSEPSIHEIRTQLSEAFPDATYQDLPDGQTFLAGALARRAITSGPLRFNLRSDSLTHPLTLKRMQQKQWQQLAVLFFSAVVLLSLNTAVMRQRDKRLAAANQTFMTAANQTVGWPMTERGEYALLTVRRELMTRNEAYAPLKQMFDRSLLELLEPILTATKSANIALQSLLLDHHQVAMQGESETTDQIERILQALNDQGFDPQMSVTRQSASVQFEISAKMQEPEP